MGVGGADLGQQIRAEGALGPVEWSQTGGGEWISSVIV